MGDTKRYGVELNLSANDKASGAMRDVARVARDTAREVRSLHDSLRMVGEAFVGSRIIGEAKKALVDYNSSLEQSKVQLSGMLAMYTGASIDKTWDRAGISVDRFTEMARKSALTTKDLVETASGLTRPLLQAGISMSDIEKMSFGVANASRAFGINGAVSALDIEQALTVGVHQRDRFSRNILAQKEVGLSMEQFNALSIDKRVEALKKALTSSAITEMAKKQGEDTFSGVMSTLEDNFQIVAGKIGLPLFRAITHEVQDWNEWIDKNRGSLEEIGRTVSSTLVTGFGYMKSVFEFIYNNAGTLLEIGKIYAGVKIGQSLGGVVGGLGGEGLLGKSQSFFSNMGKLFSRGKAAHDSIDPFTGEYTYHPSVAGGIGGAGLRGAVGALGPGGVMGIGMLAYELSEMSGLRDIVTGIVDPQRAEFERLQKTMREFDAGLKEATASVANLPGARGTVYSGNANFANQMDRRRENAINDVLFGRADSGVGGISGRAMDMISQSKRLQEAGYTQDEATKLLGRRDLLGAERDAAHNRYMFRERNQGQAAEVTDWEVAKVWKDLPESQRMLIDKAAATNAVMGEMLRTLQAGGTVLTTDQVKKIMLAANLDDPDRGIKSQAKINQTVNITIQQVSAKDPNKWIADMDDLVARKTRAKTRAKTAFKSSPQ